MAKNETQKLVAALNRVSITSKNIKKKNRNKNKNKTKKVQMGETAESLYRKMIMDPCDGPLTAPLLTGGSGQLIRLRRRFTKSELQVGVTGGTGPVCYYFSADFVNCYYNHKALSGVGVAMNASAGTDISTGAQKGYNTYLANNCVAFRGVAGCIEFNNFTTSANVSGKLAFHQSAKDAMLYCPNTSTEVYADFTKTLDFKRAPLGGKMVWKPVDTGSTWTDVDNSVIDADFRKSNGIVLAFEPGGTAGASLDFEIVVTFVVEVKYDPETGIAPGYHSYGGKSTLQTVMSTIPDDFWHGGKEIAKYALNRGIKTLGTMLTSQGPLYQTAKYLTM